MKWVNAKTELPKTTGAYIVSINMEGTSGGWIFEYVAWFYEPGKKWLRYNPFAEKTLKTFEGEITSLVIGWLDNVPPFAAREANANSL